MKQSTEEALRPERIQERILKHRTAEVTLTVVGAGGKPKANAEVSIRQVRHKFLFGCNAYTTAFMSRGISSADRVTRWGFSRLA